MTSSPVDRLLCLLPTKLTSRPQLELCQIAGSTFRGLFCMFTGIERAQACGWPGCSSTWVNVALQELGHAHGDGREDHVRCG